MFEDVTTSQWMWSSEGPQSEFAAAYAKFRSALQRAWPSADVERAVADAYTAYASAAQSAFEPAERSARAAYAYDEFNKRLRDSFATDATRAALRSAYRDYVADVQRAWTHVDASGLGADALATIAQSIAWVAGVAGHLELAFAAPDAFERAWASRTDVSNSGR
jgi:hypothetical protein